MDRDTFILLTLILFPVIVGLFVWWMTLLNRRATNFSCPRCENRIVVEAIKKDGVRCPHCDWHARAKSVAD